MDNGMSEQQPLLPSHSDPESNEEPSKYNGWRERTAEVLESPKLHKTVIALVLVDSACVLADLGYTFLSEDCTPVEGPDAPVWLTVLAHISLAITTFFLIEIPITLWASGLAYFNPRGRVPHATLHLFDAVVILTTFVLEVVLRGRERELASLLIILRLWRLVKLVQGIAVSAGEFEEEDARLLEETRRELEGVIVALAEARDENSKLRARVVHLDSEVATN